MRQFFVLLLLVFSFETHAGMKGSWVGSCIQDAEQSFESAKVSYKARGSLNGRELCLLVQALHDAKDECIKRGDPLWQDGPFDYRFDRWLREARSISSDEAETEIAKLKSIWQKSSDENIKKRISARILTIRTCYPPDKASDQNKSIGAAQ